MYCTIQNIKDLLPAGILASLTGGNDNVIARAIEKTDAVINAYVAGSYDAQNASASVFLQSVAERITVYNLYLASAYDETPEIIAKSCIEAIGDLEKIQKGLISLANADSVQSERQAEVFSNKSEKDRLFPKDGFLGF